MYNPCDWLQISEALDLILSLLEIPGKRDQIYLLMFEPQMAELLYRFLTMHDFSAPLKEKVLKVHYSYVATRIVFFSDIDFKT